MTSTFMGLELGKRALFAQQAALNTTGQNIANANTDGYTRQRAELQATNAIPYVGMSNDASAGQLGTGVEVNKISRLREDYLDVQYRGQNKDLGYYTATSDAYTKIEGIMNEPSDSGIANAMDQFWQSWQELSKTPDSASARAVVVQRGQALAESFQYTNDQLNQMSSDLNNVIQVDVSNVNSLTQQIGALNDQISKLVPNGYQPNDLYDKRDVLLDQLSKMVNVDVKPSSAGNGMVDVFVGNQAIVQGKTNNNITYPSPGGSSDQISVNGTSVSLQSGELLGRIDSYTNIIPDMQTKLTNLENSFVSQVNQLHSAQGQAYNLDDINNPSPSGQTAGLNFFVDSSDPTNTNLDYTKSINWTVNPDIASDLNKVAAASTPNAGDGNNAMAIANLKTTILNVNGTSATADDYYQNIIGQLGVSSQQAQRMQNNTQTLVTQVDNQRQSVSGVSLDEEMTNMVRFQQAYNAAARVVTTMDDVLDKVINGMGATR
ncbi:flagellar hook-associated protein FlgK [Bacillus sp. BRMEA1]|uniref:flagellar hook-associated protein FlgK n=1 Tax=Neobacillus endophyticus TaxID=2738405 RepID=UPI0015671CA4|nr:flagellar hook-associated protein FlgK [Neobacillus endophyticus]NRD79397.1 flagellar hook-associated protein FlgK [Neobacillus endophyticus]